MTTTYTVTGRWPFPLDMLRYDEARPATELDRELIERASAEYLPSKGLQVVWKITLVSERKRFFLATNCAERWKSYGWRSSLDVTAEQHPKAPAQAKPAMADTNIPAGFVLVDALALHELRMELHAMGEQIEDAAATVADEVADGDDPGTLGQASVDLTTAGQRLRAIAGVCSTCGGDGQDGDGEGPPWTCEACNGAGVTGRFPPPSSEE